MKDPAFLFYPNDWLGGTMGMTFEQKGAYMELLMLQFNRGHMTKHMIGQILGQNGGQLWDVIKDKFEVDPDGNYFNRRLEEEQNKRKAFTESRRNNIGGKNQHTKKETKNRSYDQTNDLHMTKHMENENVNENEVVIDINNWAKKFFDAKYINKNSIDTFDKLIRIDKYTPEQIKKAIQWARNDNFWTTNFLSPVKLRGRDKTGVKYIDVFLAKNLKDETAITKRDNGKGCTLEQLADVIQSEFGVNQGK